MKHAIIVILGSLIVWSPPSVNSFAPSFSLRNCQRSSQKESSTVGGPSMPLFNADNDNDNNGDNLQLLPEPEFIISDAFAILVASELMGILDDVNDPDFQGWLAPISGVPETLSELFVRFSFFSVLWFGSNIVAGQVAWAEERRTGTIAGALQAGVMFCLGRVAFEIALHEQDPNLLLVLRDGYIVTLATTAFRFLYGQYFLLR